MKKILLCMLVLLLCFSAACNTAESPSESPSSEPSVSLDPSPSTAPSDSPTPIVKPSPTPTPEPKVELLSYDEYFSVEREIEAPPFGLDDIPFGFRDGCGKTIFRNSDGYVVAEDVDDFPAVIVDKDGYYREVAFVKDNKLYITEDNGETPVVVYEATEKLRPIFFSDDPVSGVVLGFADGTRRYRLYVPTRTIDFMFDLPDVPWWADVEEEHSSAEWWDEEHPNYGVYIGGEGLQTNQTWVCACYGDKSWHHRYDDMFGEQNDGDFTSRVSPIFDLTTGKWTVWDGFDWAMDALGIPEELRVYE